MTPFSILARFFLFRGFQISWLHSPIQRGDLCRMWIFMQRSKFHDPQIERVSKEWSTATWANHHHHCLPFCSTCFLPPKITLGSISELKLQADIGESLYGGRLGAISKSQPEISSPALLPRPQISSKLPCSMCPSHDCQLCQHHTQIVQRQIHKQRREKCVQSSNAVG